MWLEPCLANLWKRSHWFVRTRQKKWPLGFRNRSLFAQKKNNNKENKNQRYYSVNLIVGFVNNRPGFKILTLQYAPLLSQRKNVRTSSDMCGICHHRKHVLLAFIIFICYFWPLLFLLHDRFEMCAFWLKEISFFYCNFESSKSCLPAFKIEIKKNSSTSTHTHSSQLHSRTCKAIE